MGGVVYYRAGLISNLKALFSYLNIVFIQNSNNCNEPLKENSTLGTSCR